MRRTQNVGKMMVLTVAVLALSSCAFFESFVPDKNAKSDVVDRQQGLTTDDFRDLNKADKLLDDSAPVKASAQLGAPPLPDLAQVLAAPRPPKVANTKLVTLAVTEDVPLRDVLFELGRLAKVDIEVGNGLDKTGINLRATDQPFNEVIERISDLGGLRYSVKGNSIRVERDVPYIKNYSLDFLNIVRSSASSYTLSTNILSGSGGSSTGGPSTGGSSSSGSASSTSGGVGTSGSSNSITSQAESDLWSSLEASVSEILDQTSEVGTGSQAAASRLTSGSTAAAPAVAGGNRSAVAAAGLVINRQAGVLSVNATERQHEMIKRFLSLMSRNSSAQVLIEAKIVEVALADQFLSGINWSKLIGDVGGNRLRLGNFQPLGIDTLALSAAGINGGANSSGAITFGLEGGDLDAVLSLTQRYGTTRTLSSPRLSAINNQQAVLTFARNVVFFNCTATPATTSSTASGVSISGSNPTVDCEQNTVPIGIILSILPSVNLDTQEITLSVRPTLTRQVDTAVNPETGYIRSLIANSAATSSITIPDITVPVIEVRELDSVMKVRSGGVMVIGGLMEDTSRNQDDGVPGLSEAPLLGNLFKSRSENSRKSELIVFIKATIVNPDGSATSIDRAVYQKYVTDPRPLFPKQ